MSEMPRIYVLRRQPKTQPLDDHGQPLNFRLFASRVRHDRVAELVGICKGILMDKEVSDGELKYLRGWFEKNPETLEDPLVRLLYDELTQVQQAQGMEDEARKNLQALLERFTGGSIDDFGSDNPSSKLPLDNPPPEVIFGGKSFCLTGKFLYGGRKECIAAIEGRGGIWMDNPTQDIDYLVIGNCGSRAWLHSTHGLKIQRALELRETGGRIKIISEAHWAKALEVNLPRAEKMFLRRKSRRLKHRPLPSSGASNGHFTGKTVVVTGTLEQFSRAEAQEALRRAGANVTDSVSKKTDFLVVGAEAGSKLDKAQKLGVKTLTEAEFVKMLG
ncbi:MAG: hypothetical protein FJ395_09770 [Verrucomicrobia bacterium]|nr:hypothetical protein [Verrucomicrobiota bacterium]